MLSIVKLTVGLLLLSKICTSEDSFWLTAELVSVEWKKGCLTTGGCADPRFKLTETNLVSNEQVSVSWSILEDFNQERSRTFVSHWKRGYPTDVTLVCEVVGIDPTYGFPRICDATANVQIFEKEIREIKFDHQTVQTENSEIGDGKMVVEVKGKCFNASLTVEKHEHRCPWCPQKQEQLAFVAQPEVETANATSLMHYFGGGEQLLCIAVTVLAGIAIISTAAFACLLIAFIKQKRDTPTAKQQISTFPLSGIRVDAVKIPDDSRYEMPWDQKYRPLPHWLSNRGELNASSPNDSASSTSGPLFYQMSRTTLGGLTHYESPSTSISDRHDDSGLESV